MTNFGKCLYDLIDSADIARKEERIKNNMLSFNITAEDAVMLDNELIATSRTICRIVGHKLDSLPAHLQHCGIKVLPGSVALGLMSAHDMLGAMLNEMPLEILGMDSPSDDCDCKSCTIKRAMMAEIALVKESDDGQS